jgi:hypothetical protein
MSRTDPATPISKRRLRGGAYGIAILLIRDLTGKVVV